MRPWILTVLSFALASSLVSGQVVNPRITTDSSVDCSSAQAVVKQILTPGMTDEEKVIACWRFMLDHFYHWYPPREPDVGKDVRDFAKMINSYGFAPCFVNAPVLTALWEAAGFETRSWTITGHSIPEVKYGGAWHMLDADARAWHRKADGQIADVVELSKDPTLFTAPKEKSRPYYPFGAPDVTCRPLDPWGPPSRMMDLYASRRNNYRYNKRAVMGHPMYLTLRQGERISLSYDNEGKFYNAGFPKDKLDTGPIEINGKYTYGSGRLIWEPDFKKISADQLLWLGSKNVKLEGGRLKAIKADEPAVAVLQIRSPYVLVTGRVTVQSAGTTPKFDLSYDGGHAWWDVPPRGVMGNGPPSRMNILSDIDTTERVAGRYTYLFRVTFGGGDIGAVAFENLFQVSQLSLPRLKPGTNKVTIFRGPDEGVVSLTLAKGKHAKPRYIVKSEGLKTPNAIQPPEYDKPGYVIYRLTAPAELTALSIGGHLTMDRGRGQHIAASYSLDAGKTWNEIWRIADNTNRDNSSFEEDAYVTLENAGTNEVLIKFAMIRRSKYFGVNSIRLYGFYKQPQPKDAKLTVDLVWQEKTGDTWAEKKRSLVVDTFPHTFDLECGGKEVRLKRIDMAPAQ